MTPLESHSNIKVAPHNSTEDLKNLRDTADILAAIGMEIIPINNKKRPCDHLTRNDQLKKARITIELMKSQNVTRKVSLFELALKFKHQRPDVTMEDVRKLLNSLNDTQINDSKIEKTLSSQKNLHPVDSLQSKNFQALLHDTRSKLT